MPLLMTSRILIADDHEDNRELMRLMLGDASYDVLEARDGQECLQVAREQQPDLIMIDISMPMLDGWEVFQQLKTDERTSHIPCVAVTGYADIDHHRALTAGFHAYLSKPFRSEALLQMVTQVLAGEKVKANAAGRATNEL
jgi:CheY-like chemotaxis protein